jgi:hypothetical protein
MPDVTFPVDADELHGMVLRTLDPVWWIITGDYPEPSDEMKPFVFALMGRACQGDEDAVLSLLKLFPPRCSG